MAYRNIPPEKRSEFGKRLWSLIEEKGYKTAEQMAEKLIDLGLMGKDIFQGIDDDDKDAKRVKRNNTILSLTRRINRTIVMENPEQIPADLLMVYAEHFECSTDYILLRTNIRTNDFDIRCICEKTCLSEAAVTRLLKGAPIEADFWSMFIGNDELSLDIITCWLRINNARKNLVLTEEGIESIKSISEIKKKPEFADIESDPMKSMLIQHQKNTETFDSNLYKFTRLFAAGAEMEVNRIAKEKKWHKTEHKYIYPIMMKWYNGRDYIMDKVLSKSSFIKHDLNDKLRQKEEPSPTNSPD